MQGTSVVVKACNSPSTSSLYVCVDDSLKYASSDHGDPASVAWIKRSLESLVRWAGWAVGDVYSIGDMRSVGAARSFIARLLQSS